MGLFRLGYTKNPGVDGSRVMDGFDLSVFLRFLGGGGGGGGGEGIFMIDG